MAITVNTQQTSSGVVNHSTGFLTNDAGGAVAVSLAVGFVPRMFEIVNITDRIGYKWIAGMTSPSSIKTIATGVRTLEGAESPTIGTIALGTDGTVSVPATIILASKSFTWEAVA